MPAITYDGLSRDALVHLLSTSPFVGQAWRKDVPIEISILTSPGGRRVGRVKLDPELIVDGLIDGHLSRSHLDAVVQLNALAPGMGPEIVTAQKPGTALFPIWETLTLSAFYEEGRGPVRVGPLFPNDLEYAYDTLTFWSDLLYPEGKAAVCGTATSFYGLGASAQAMARDEDIIDGSKLGNPWTGSDFVGATKFVVNEDAMFHEIYKGGKLWWRNGDIVEPMVAASEVTSRSETAEVIKQLVDQLVEAE